VDDRHYDIEFDAIQDIECALVSDDVLLFPTQVPYAMQRARNGPQLLLQAPATSMGLTEGIQPIHYKHSIHIHALRPQICSRKINLFHKLRMRLGHIIESKHSPTEFEEQVCAKCNEGPKWQLRKVISKCYLTPV